jgi:hypothetical protein
MALRSIVGLLLGCEDDVDGALRSIVGLLLGCEDDVDGGPSEGDKVGLKTVWRFVQSLDCY